MSPGTSIEALRAEIKALEKMCTGQIALCQRDIAAQAGWCNKRRAETRDAIQKLLAANLEQKRAELEYHKAAAENAANVNKLIRRLISKVGGCNGE